MSDLLTELTAKAGGLSLQERAELAHCLLASIHPEELLGEAEWERAWSEEIALRVARLDAGEPTIAAEEVMAEAKRRFG